MEFHATRIPDPIPATHEVLARAADHCAAARKRPEVIRPFQRLKKILQTAFFEATRICVDSVDRQGHVRHLRQGAGRGGYREL